MLRRSLLFLFGLSLRYGCFKVKRPNEVVNDMDLALLARFVHSGNRRFRAEYMEPVCWRGLWPEDRDLDGGGCGERGCGAYVGRKPGYYKGRWNDLELGI